MINGAEVLVTDPGREVRLKFVETLKLLSGVTGGKYPASISRESLVSFSAQYEFSFCM
jgi:hypothetical protein